MVLKLLATKLELAIWESFWDQGKWEGKTYHHLVKRHPTVWREVLQHGHQELQTAIPVAQKQHHANQIEDAHHRTGQVISHVKDLSVKIKEALHLAEGKGFLGQSGSNY